ncbi:hypothetical protein HK101_002588 [Irineochytrium annulatum]|nr:hypothetical protein HK101_002588 [Irineochytrium annulatum]
MNEDVRRSTPAKAPKMKSGGVGTPASTRKTPRTMPVKTPTSAKSRRARTPADFDTTVHDLSTHKLTPQQKRLRELAREQSTQSHQSRNNFEEALSSTSSGSSSPVNHISPAVVRRVTTPVSAGSTRGNTPASSMRATPPQTAHRASSTEHQPKPAAIQKQPLAVALAAATTAASQSLREEDFDQELSRWRDNRRVVRSLRREAQRERELSSASTTAAGTPSVPEDEEDGTSDDDSLDVDPGSGGIAELTRRAARSRFAAEAIEGILPRSELKSLAFALNHLLVQMGGRAVRPHVLDALEDEEKKSEEKRRKKMSAGALLRLASQITLSLTDACSVQMQRSATRIDALERRLASCEANVKIERRAREEGAVTMDTKIKGCMEEVEKVAWVTEEEVGIVRKQVGCVLRDVASLASMVGGKDGKSENDGGHKKEEVVDRERILADLAMSKHTLGRTCSSGERGNDEAHESRLLT